MSAIDAIKYHKRSIIEKYARPDDRKAILQILTTLVPLGALWLAAMMLPAHSPLALSMAIAGISLLLLRCFSLMHDCGHNSLFKTRALNRVTGFILGVLTSMPQFVWSQHHNYHHAHNGNWAKYRGPLSILSVDEFAVLSDRQQRLYTAVRTIWLAPLAGLMYLIVNPRVNWLRGVAGLLRHNVLRALGRAQGPFQTRRWASPAQFWHMAANNVVLLGLWASQCAWFGAERFFLVYLLGTSLAGGLGIVLFTVQHNFEHAYASGDQGWDYDTAAIEGSSFLALPAWLNWFTADIGFHHIHHLSARIPNYRLAACHAEYRHLFDGVKQLTLADVKRSLDYLLWDEASRRIITVGEYVTATQVLEAA